MDVSAQAEGGSRFALSLPFCSIRAPMAQSVKNQPAMQETACHSIPGSGRSTGGGNGNPLQYSCLGNPMDRKAWRTAVPGVARVQHDLATKPPPEPPVDWRMLPTSKSHLYYSVRQFKFQSLPETSLEAHPEIIFHQLSENHLA